MSWLALVIFIVIAAVVLQRFRQRQQAQLREQFIDNYQFPDKIGRSLKSKYPHLTERDIHEVLKALKDYFHICHIAGKKNISMPSQVVDVAWHELILFTLRYQHFCQKAFGRFLHHTPAEAMASPTVATQGIKRAWRIACVREGIAPHRPDVLPLIFAIDHKLGIADGFTYRLRCDPSRQGDSYCASDIGCSSSGCTGSSDATSSCTSDSSGCSSGCGGGD